MIRTDKRLRICQVLLICNLIFIWGNSLLPAEQSLALSNWVRSLLPDMTAEGISIGGGSGLLRKIAHFVEFCSLGVCLGWLLGMLKKKAVYAVLLGVAVACIDEIIQMFVPERGPGLRDVLLDSCGVLTGVILVYLGYTLIKRRTTN